MKKDLLYDNLLEAIREKIPHKATLTSALVDMLCIEKEAVYRRLRGEVAFTFSEIAKISNELGLSLDNVVETHSSKSRPFQLKLIEYIDPLETDYSMLDNYIDILKLARREGDSKVVDCTNVLPQPLYLNYEYLSQFYLFKWMYQCGIKIPMTPFDDIKITERLRKIQKANVKESKYIKNTYYVWDPLIFQYIVNDIRYFYSVHLIKSEEIQLLKNDLLKFINDMEVLAAKGYYEETGNKVLFYISNINFETSYWFVEMSNIHISMIKAFTLNAVASLDEKTFERLKKWSYSLLRSSTMISVSGEKQRILFFERQREIINNI